MPNTQAINRLIKYFKDMPPDTVFMMDSYRLTAYEGEADDLTRDVIEERSGTPRLEPNWCGTALCIAGAHNWLDAVERALEENPNFSKLPVSRFHEIVNHHYDVLTRGDDAERAGPALGLTDDEAAELFQPDHLFLPYTAEHGVRMLEFVRDENPTYQDIRKEWNRIAEEIFEERPDLR